MDMRKKTMRRFSASKLLAIGFLSLLFMWALPLTAQHWECVDFEDLKPKQMFGLGETFMDSGTSITVEQSLGLDGKPVSTAGTAMVVTGTEKAGGSGNEILLDPFNLRFRFPTPPNGLTLRFSETGIGNINIEINGDLRLEKHLTDVNGAFIGGVRVTVIGGSVNQKGILELSGRIDSFVIGGFELFIDDVCPIMEGTSLYFSDSTQSPGSVYKYRADTRSKTAIYTRPSSRLYSFVFAPWDPNRLYYVNANEFKVYAAALDTGILTEEVIFTHTTYVRDIAFDNRGILYFSEATGSARNGKIWRIEPDGTATLFYTVKLSQVDGSWAGTFTFATDNTLFLSSGNRIPAHLYEVDAAADIVTKIFTDTGNAIVGIFFGPDGLLYYGNNNTRIYSLDLASLSSNIAYEDPHQQIWDVGFREPAPVPTIPGTWVMPYAVRQIRFNQVKSTGLIDYTDAASDIHMVDAPFGGDLWFRLGSSDDIPTTKVHYYRYRYRRQGTAGWNDFDTNISVHYVKNRPGKTPIFPLFKLGPYDVNGMKLYRFRPHESKLSTLVPVAPGETVGWPKIPFAGDVYRAHLNTVGEGLAPGKYEFRVDIYDDGGIQTTPGSIFQMIVDIGVDADGTILTAPATIVDGGIQFVLHIDNSTCSAEIAPPAIGTTETDDCGFLRYNPDDPGLVHIGWHAWHPGGFAVYRFNIVRGASGIGTLPLPPTPGDPTPSIPLPLGDEVTSSDYNGDGAGNFFVESPTDRLLGECTEAAFAISLHVYAKATNGNGYRIAQYDAHRLIAFALAPIGQ
jgi:hypothetical protein